MKLSVESGLQGGVIDGMVVHGNIDTGYWRSGWKFSSPVVLARCQNALL